MHHVMHLSYNKIEHLTSGENLEVHCKITTPAEECS